jgi:hypothetical protein
MARTLNGDDRIIQADAIGKNVGTYRAAKANWNFTDDGGAMGVYPIFTVTGDVYIQQIYGACKTSLTGAGATIELGTIDNTAVFIAQTTATALDQYELWQGAIPGANPAVVILLSRSWVLQNGRDIALTVGTAALTAGDIDFYCNWIPLSKDGNVSAGRPLLSYEDKVLSYGPIAYWPLHEAYGTVGHCLVNNAQNGTAARDFSTMTTGVGIGDGNTAPLFDATNDYVDVHSATVAAAFDGALGSLIIHGRIPAAAWIDSTIRYLVRFRADANNRLSILKTATNNQLNMFYRAGGTTDSVADVSLAGSTDWFCAAITWSKAAEEVKAYINGVQVGTTQVALGVWAGALDATASIIGAGTTGPVSLFSGHLAHCSLFDKVLSDVEIADLAGI